MKIQETVREDGLRMISCAIPGVKRVFVELVALVGSAYDADERLGQHHFDEHMAFAGTKTRSQDGIQSFLEEQATRYNASTGHLLTRYHIETVHYKMSIACELLADIYCNSTVPEAELNREREVILNELAAANDDDDDLVREMMATALWRNNPMKRPILGTSETLARVTREDILEAHMKWHVPANTVAIGVGKVSHNEFAAEISRQIPMKGAAPTPYKGNWDDESSTSPAQRQIFLQKSGREQATILYGIKMPRYDADAERENIVEQIFFEILNSRLFREIRQKRGLVYGVWSGRFGERELASHFGVMASSTKPEPVLALIPEVLSQPLNDSEKFTKTKEAFRAHYEIGFDGTPLDHIARAIMGRLGKRRPLRDLTNFTQRAQRMLKRITLEEVEALRQKTCVTANAAITMVKP